MADQQTFVQNIEQNLTQNISISGKEEIRELREQNEALSETIGNLQTRISNLTSDLANIKGTSIGVLKSQVEDLQETFADAARELRNMLRANSIDSYMIPGINEIVETVEKGESTVIQAFTRIKSEYSELFRESASAEGFDNGQVERFSSALDGLRRELDEVLSKINEIYTKLDQGVNVKNYVQGDAQAIQELGESYDKASANLQSSMSTFNQMAETVDGTASSIQVSLSKVLESLAKLGGGDIKTTGATNIVKALAGLDKLNTTNLAILSNINWSNLNNLKASKASLSNLATYLPTIGEASVVNNLERLSKINFNKLSNLKISKSTLDALSRLTVVNEISSKLGSAIDKWNLASESTSKGVSSKSSDTKEIAAQYREMSAAIDEYAKAKTAILKVDSESTQYQVLSNRLQTATVNYNKYLDAVREGTIAEENASKLNRKNAEAVQKIAEEEAKAADKIIKAVKEKDAARKEAAAKEEAAEAAAAKATMEAAEQEVATTKEIAAARQNLANTIMQEERALKNYSSAEHSSNESSRNAYQAIKDNVSALKNLGIQNGATKKEVESLNSEVAKSKTVLKDSEATIKSNGDATRTLGQRVASLAEKFATWFSISRVIMSTVQKTKELIKTSIELEDALVQLQIVTKDSDDVIRSFGDTAVDSAKRLGVAVTDLIDATTTYARLGYDLNESSTLAELTGMLQMVGNIDASSAQDAITAMVKAFDIDVSGLETVMDKLVAVGNGAPISVSQIAEAMNNASSVLAAAGNDVNQSIALLTAANTTIQNASKSSTGLRTIVARIRNMTTELDELGETMESAKYDEIVQALTDMRVSITDQQGELRSTYDILSDISKAWADMTANEKAALAQTLAGTRQQAVFFSLMDNFNEATAAMKLMENSTNELQDSFQVYADSTTAHINKLKASFAELGRDIFDSSLLKGAVDIANGFVELIDKILVKSGLLLPIVEALIGAVVSAKWGQIASSITGVLDKINKFRTNIGQLISTFTQTVGQTHSLATGFQAVGKAAKEMGIAVSSANVYIALITAAIMALTLAIQAYKKEEEERRAGIEEASKAAIKQNTEIKALIDRYKELKDSAINNEDTRKEMAEITETLIKSYGVEKSEIQNLAADYKDYSRAVEEAAEKKIEFNNRAVKDQLNEVAGDLSREVGGSLLNPDFNINIEFAYSSKEALDIIKEFGEGTLFENGSLGIVKQLTLWGDGTANSLIQNYETLGRILDEMSAKNLNQTKEYEALNSEYIKLSGSVNEYKELYKELYGVELSFAAIENGHRDSFGRSFEEDAKAFDNMKAQAVEAATSVEDLSTSLKTLKSNYDLLNSATEEMNSSEGDGGLSADTINSVKEAIESMNEARKEAGQEELNYIDYLYRENDVIKLNTGAWQELADAQMVDNITGIENRIKTLQQEREELEKLKSEYTASGDMWRQGDINSINQSLKENADAIANASAELEIYRTVLDEYRDSLNQIEAVNPFEALGNYIEDISGKLTTLADLQEAVGESFTMSIDKALEFANVYPEILNGAQATADGQITLNEGVVNSFIEGQEAEIKADVESNIRKLEADLQYVEAKKSYAEAMLALVNAAMNAEALSEQDLQTYKQEVQNGTYEHLVEMLDNEAAANELTMLAMADDEQSFAEAAKTACTDTAGNFNQSAYDSAMAIYRACSAMNASLYSTERQAAGATRQVAEIGNGKNANAGVGGVLGATAYGGSSMGNYSVTSSPFGSMGGASASNISSPAVSSAAKRQEIIDRKNLNNLERDWLPGWKGSNLERVLINGTEISRTAFNSNLQALANELSAAINAYTQEASTISSKIEALRALGSANLEKFGSGAGSGSSGSSGSGGSGSGGSGSDSAKEDAEETLETVDWISIAIERTTSLIDRLGKKVSSTYKTIAERLGFAKDEIDAITDAIALQTASYSLYMDAANNVGLSEDLKYRVQHGYLDIAEYDKETKELIDTYTQWYDAALKAADSIEELTEQLGDLYKQEMELNKLDLEQKFKVLDSYNAYAENRLSEYRVLNTNHFSIEHELLEDRETLLRENIEKQRQLIDEAGWVYGSQEYMEAWDQIREWQQEINDIELEHYELAEREFEREKARFDDQIAELDSLSEMLQDRLDVSNATDFGIYSQLVDNEEKRLEIINEEIERLTFLVAGIGEEGSEKRNSALAEIRELQNERNRIENTIASLWMEKFDQMTKVHENQIALIDAEISSQEARLNSYTKKDITIYEALEDMTRDKLHKTQAEIKVLNQLLKEMEGTIEEGSQDWVDIQLQIKEATNRLEEYNAEMAKYRMSEFQDVQSQYDHQLKKFEHLTTMYELSLNDYTVADKAYYRDLEQVSLDTLQKMENEYLALSQYKDSFNVGSEDWWTVRETLDELEERIARQKQTTASLYRDNFDAIQNRYSNEASLLEHDLEMLQNSLKSYKVNSISTYEEMGTVIEQQIRDAQRELYELKHALEEALNSGLIEEFSNEWYAMMSVINGVESRIESLYDSYAQLSVDRFNEVQKGYENQLQLIDHMTNKINTGMRALSAQGMFQSKNLYAALIDNTSERIGVLNQQLADMTRALEEANVDMYSEDWYTMMNAINSVRDSINDATVSLMEYERAMKKLEWDYFDWEMDRVSAINDETEFLINLLGHKDLYAESGLLNNEGMATLGLMAEMYNLYMAEADKYGAEYSKILQEIASNPYDTELYERRDALHKLQQQMILSAEDEKDAIVDLVENGINLELDSLKELIERYKDSLDEAKALYDYQKKIEDQTEKIASLRKQLAAYENDTSEETRARIQKLTVDLKDAEEELAETEFDHYISEAKKLLDQFYLDYSSLLNSRLDNTDLLISQVIDAVNANAQGVSGTGYQIVMDADGNTGKLIQDADNNRDLIIWDIDGRVEEVKWDNASNTGYIVDANGMTTDALITGTGELTGSFAENSESIWKTIEDATDNVGYKVSDENWRIWNDQEKVVAQYMNGEFGYQTNVLTCLSNITALVADMVAAANAAAASYTTPDPVISSAGAASFPSFDDFVTEEPVGKTSLGTPFRIATTYYTDDMSAEEMDTNWRDAIIPGTNKTYGEGALETNLSMIKGQIGADEIGYAIETLDDQNHVRYVTVASTDDLSNKDLRDYLSGQFSWFKSITDTRSIAGYAKGGKVEYTGLAMLHGSKSNPETVLNPSDTKLFTALTETLRTIPLSTLTDLANSGLSKSIGTNGGINVGDTTINIDIDHVEDYNDLVNQMKADHQFEKFIQSMTTERLVGKSSLSKNRYQW